MTFFLQKIVFSIIKKLIKLLIKLISLLWLISWGKVLLGILVLLAIPAIYHSGMWPAAIIVCLIGLTLILIGIAQMTARSSELIPKNLRRLQQRVSAFVLSKTSRGIKTSPRTSIAESTRFARSLRRRGTLRIVRAFCVTSSPIRPSPINS